MTDRGRPIHVDPDAKSADPELPGFIVRPAEEPVYHGFPVLDVEVEGFRLGAISGFGLDELDTSDADGTLGDAFVIGPDGRRAGLVWEVGETYFEPILDGDGNPLASVDRVGVYGVAFPRPMRTLDDAHANLASIVPSLKKEWAG
jgi:hypothetical protein